MSKTMLRSVEFSSTSALVKAMATLSSGFGMWFGNILSSLVHIVNLGLGINPCPSCKAGNGSRVVANINNVTFVMPTTTLLQAHCFKTSGDFTTDFPANPPFVYNYTDTPSANLGTTGGTKVYKLPYNATGQVVLQYTSVISPENHPIHLHGFNFFVFGRGLRNFNQKKDPKNFNLVDPVERNTVGVPSGGWTFIRFRADNPGTLECVTL
ncbi:Plastocyanin-like domain-containing protein [Heracleum sosnowskyi]|uniref:Plastocyanin-like domain-containing protein n=1 Tax=Heracleum sosnowskyi TaxID=360622 RepID=A0AAD8I0D0_9APIA|nr:Plastocyanin-like domain-containing protein [Heracleum sosnowskyi]